MHYDDGTSAERPLRNITDAGDWYENNFQPEEGAIGWRGTEGC